jgi:hypothetical protein
VISASFLYTHADHLPAFIDLNLPPPTARKGYVINGGPLNGVNFDVPYFLSYSTASNGAFTRPITNFGAIIDMESVSKSDYSALVLQLQRRMTKGLSLQSNYTWSKATDYGQQFGTFAASFMTVSNPFDLRDDKSLSANNVPHKFVASAVWVPATFFHMAKSGVAHAIFGDLQLSPITVISAGYAIPATIPSTFPSPPSFVTVSNTLYGAGGVLGIPFLRNLNRRPYTWTTDLRVSKRIHFTEHMSLELLAEGFNIFNKSNVTGVNTSYISSINFGSNSQIGVLNYNPAYGSTTSINNTIIFSPRQIQLGARFHF